ACWAQAGTLKFPGLVSYLIWWGIRLCPTSLVFQECMKAFALPFYKDMHEATSALIDRKFGAGGPFNKDTNGPWKESSRIRSSAKFHDPEFQECVSVMAQYILETYGKFPGTIPAIYSLTYL